MIDISLLINPIILTIKYDLFFLIQIEFIIFIKNFAHCFSNHLYQYFLNKNILSSYDRTRMQVNFCLFITIANTKLLF